MHPHVNWDIKKPVVTHQLQAGAEQSPWRSTFLLRGSGVLTLL